MLMCVSCATDRAERSPVESRRPEVPRQSPEARETTDSDRSEQESAEASESVETSVETVDSDRGEQESVESLDDDVLLEMVVDFVNEVHELIASGEYDAWRALLTERYVEHYSDNDVLAALSESPVLERNNVTLDGLRDYFDHVVRASRTNVDVKAVEVQGENTALALSEVGGEPAVLFNLVRDNEDWKIDHY